MLHGNGIVYTRGVRRLLRMAAWLLLPALLLTGCAKEEPGPAEGADPAHSTIAVLVGTTSEALAETTYPKAEILKFDALSDAVTALQSGKAEFVLTAYTNCVNYARNQKGLTVLDDVWLSSEPCAIAVNKEETALLAAISDQIERYRGDGTLDTLKSNWIRTDGSAYVTTDIPEDPDAPGLDVAISAEREPMCFVSDGAYAGMDIELARMLCRDLGYRPVFHDMKFSAMIPSVLSNKTPIAISNISATEERKESVNFSPDYFTNPQTLLTRKELAPGAGTEQTTLESLNGKTMGVLTGTVFDQATTEFLPDSPQSFYNGASDLIIALEQGKIDGFMTDEPIARLMLAGDGALSMLPELLRREDYAFAFPKTEAGERYRDEMNEYLAKLDAEGTLDKLVAKWMDGAESDKQMADVEGIKGSNGTLCMASSFESEPFSYMRDNRYVGFEMELIGDFCRAHGYGLEINNANFSALIPGLVSGSFDVAASCITITAERAESVHFSDPIYNGGVAMMIRAASPTQAETETGFWASLKSSFDKNFIREQRWKLLAEGMGVTLLISVCSAVLGAAIGFGVCMLRRGKKAVFSGAAKAFIRLIQGTPIVVLLMILYYVVLNKTGLDGVAVAILAFGVNFGAYVAEILRSGLDAVDPGQMEAAAAIGFTKGETFWLITMPQAARHFLPVLKGEFISLVKMTSVVGYVAVQDLTKASDIIRSRTFEAFFPLIVTAILYFLLAWGLSSLLGLIEVRTDPKHRKRALQKKNGLKGAAA